MAFKFKFLRVLFIQLLEGVHMKTYGAIVTFVLHLLQFKLQDRHSCLLTTLKEFSESF